MMFLFLLPPPPTSTLPPLLPSSSNTLRTLCAVSIFLHVWYYTGAWLIYRGYANKENLFSLCQQLLWVGSCAYHFHPPCQNSCMLSQPFRIHMFIFLAVSEKCCFLVAMYIFWVCCSSCHFFSSILWDLTVENVIKISHLRLNITVPFSAYWSLIDMCIKWNQLPIEASLVRVGSVLIYWKIHLLCKYCIYIILLSLFSYIHLSFPPF